VFIFGGIGEDGVVLNSAEQFDPATATLTQVGSVGLGARAYHTATVLTDGRVLVVSGEGADRHLSHEAETYDPTTRDVTVIAQSTGMGRLQPEGGLMPDGSVLLWGGAVGAEGARETGILFDPANNDLKEVDEFAFRRLVSSVQMDVAPSVVYSQPASAASDTPVSGALEVRFSTRMNVTTLSDRTVTLVGPHGVTDVALTPVDQGMLLFIVPRQDLVPGSPYTLFINGAVDARGRSLPFLAQGFTTKTLGIAADSASPSTSPRSVAIQGMDSVGPQPTFSRTAAPNNGVLKQGARSAATDTLARGANPQTAIATNAKSDTQRTEVSATSGHAAAQLDAERWRPTSANYHGDWRSRRSGVAANFMPHDDLLRRALHGHPETIAVMNKVTPGTVASGVLRNLVAPEHLAEASAVTAVSGQILRLNGQPLGEVTLSIGTRSVRTDRNGEFTLARIPAGHQVLVIDGSSANQNGHQYGRYEYGLDITAGRRFVLPFVIWMTALDTEHLWSSRIPKCRVLSSGSRLAP
jgi:hypothetical protein